MTPAFRVVVDGHHDVTAAISSRLLSLSVSDLDGWESDSCRTEIEDDGAFQLPRRGAALAVEMGFDSDLSAMGSYTVDEVVSAGWPMAVTIVARAADFRDTLKERRTRSWAATTLGAIADEIARRHGLRADVTSSVGAARIEQADQVDESDLNLLTRLSEARGGALKIAEGRIVIVVAGSGASVSGAALAAVTLRPADLQSYRATLADRPRYQSVTAAWQSFAEGRQRLERAGDGSPVFAIRGTFASQPEAAAAARAKLAELQRSTATLRLALDPGNPRCRAETPVELAGFRPGLPTSWIASTAKHELGRRGYTTKLTLAQAS